MKRLKITASTGGGLPEGSYVLGRDGIVRKVMMHVPSTTYLDRGIFHLCCTDAQFLLDEGYIDDDEAYMIMTYCFKEYLESQNQTDWSVLDTTKFIAYAELRYAKDIRALFLELGTSGQLSTLDDILLDRPSFGEINDRWYNYLKNNFVKLSRFRDVVEFRISSDNYDWNKEIIDKVILNPKYDLSRCRFTICRESDKGYKSYFMNATIDDVLENDKLVMSSTKLYKRKVVAGHLKYEEI